MTEAKKIEEGIYTDIPFAEYQKIEAIRNSYLGRIDKTPAHTLVEQKITDALIWGRATHSLILEGQEAFDESCVILPEMNRKTKAGRAEYAQFQIDNISKGIISAGDYEVIKAMKVAVYQHPAAVTLLEEGLSEQTVIWKDKDTGLLCKARPDRSPNPETRTLIDLKTTVDAGEVAFMRSVIKFGYARQNAFYVDGMNSQITEPQRPFDSFVFIVVEKTEPYRVECYVLDEDMVKWGRSEYKRLMGIEIECRENGSYPHYENPGITTLFRPNWMV